MSVQASLGSCPGSVRGRGADQDERRKRGMVLREVAEKDPQSFLIVYTSGERGGWWFDYVQICRRVCTSSCSSLHTYWIITNLGIRSKYPVDLRVSMCVLLLCLHTQTDTKLLVMQHIIWQPYWRTSALWSEVIRCMRQSRFLCWHSLQTNHDLSMAGG